MSNNKINERLKQIAKSKDESKQTQAQAEMRAHMTEGKDESPDFAKIAAELQNRHARMKRSPNEGHVKDTIYIQKDILESFNALCLQRGDKKKYVNQALADFVLKKHKELKQKND